MSGSLTFDLPEYCFRGETFLVEASGITSPKGDSVSFTFEGDHFTPDSIEAATAEIKVPDSLGTYTLTLTARAEGYANSVTSRKTTVIHNVFSVMQKGLNLHQIPLPIQETAMFIITNGSETWTGSSRI